MDAKRFDKPAFLARLAVVAALAFAIAMPALAQGEFAVAREGGRVAASATLHFRIVVPEKVVFDSQSLGMKQQARADNKPAVQRQVADLGDRKLVTLANP